jgi:hypothetical protein
MKIPFLFPLKLIVVAVLITVGSAKSYSQKTIAKHCYFKNHQSEEYYSKIFDEYKLKQDLECFKNMIDSLLFWCEKDSLQKNIKVLDALISHADGVYADQGDKVVEFLSELYFGDFAKYMVAHKSSYIRYFFIEYYGRHIYNAEDHDKRRDKFYETFDAKIDKSSLPNNEKTKAKVFIHSIKFEDQ